MWLNCTRGTDWDSVWLKSARVCSGGKWWMWHRVCSLHGFGKGVGSAERCGEEWRATTCWEPAAPATSMGRGGEQRLTPALCFPTFPHPAPTHSRWEGTWPGAGRPSIVTHTRWSFINETQYLLWIIMSVFEGFFPALLVAKCGTVDPGRS